MKTRTLYGVLVTALALLLFTFWDTHNAHAQELRKTSLAAGWGEGHIAIATATFKELPHIEFHAGKIFQSKPNKKGETSDATNNPQKGDELLDYTVVGADYVFESLHEEGLPFVAINLGLSYFDAETPNIKSRTQIHAAVTIGVNLSDGAVLGFGGDHWSNADLWGNDEKTNMGETFFVVRYSWNF